MVKGTGIPQGPL